MLPFKTLLKIDKTSPEAVFKQIASQLVLLIQKGILMPDMQLPSTRQLAADLDLHRKTIMAAYNMLIAEDWLVSKERKEYRVSTLLPIIKPRSYASKAKSSYKAEPAIVFDRLDHVPSFPELSAGAKVIVDDGFPYVDIFPVERVSSEYRRLLTHQTLKKSNASWNLDGSPVLKRLCRPF
ncbi:MAG TPA: GntR family transcriptional regulator [Mucilaginibacter sp.]